MKITFSIKTPLFTVSEDDASRVSFTARMQSDLGEGPRELGSVNVTRDLGEPVAPETFAPLHREPVEEGRAHGGCVWERLPGDPT